MKETTFDIGQKLPFDPNGFLFLFNSGHPIIIVQDHLSGQRREAGELTIQATLDTDGGFLNLREELSGRTTRFDYRIEDFAETPELEEELLNVGLDCIVILAHADGTIYNICDSALAPGLGKRVYGYYKKYRRGIQMPYFDVRDMIYVHQSAVDLAFEATH